MAGASRAADQSWPVYLGDHSNTHFSTLKQIDRRNVRRLKVAWAWRTTLGELPELTARGIPPTGTENYGGPVVTAGSLIFIAAFKDERLHAFDQETGKLLWQAGLPAGGYATPST
jgi:quinoprotein glucose dehydrogenase